MSTTDNVTVTSDWTRADDDDLTGLRAHSVANIGDAMGRLNILDGGIHPIWHGAKAVGSALPILTVAGDNRAVIEALDHIRPGDILVINAFGYDGRAIMRE